MTVYTGRQSIFDEAVGIYRPMGFSLSAVDDGTLELTFRGIIIAIYNPLTVTIAEIRGFCLAFRALLEELASF
jgi:hypothetical protein